MISCFGSALIQIGAVSRFRSTATCRSAARAERRRPRLRTSRTRSINSGRGIAGGRAKYMSSVKSGVNPLGLPDDRLERFAPLFVGLLLQQILAVSGDDGERVVDLMAGPGRELGDSAASFAA